MKHISFQQGFAALYLTIVVLGLAIVFAASLLLLSLNQQRIVHRAIQSTQAYFTSEAGIEDALLRVTQGLQWTNPQTIQIGATLATVTVEGANGTAKTITATGESLGKIRKEEVAVRLQGVDPTFFYGAHIGAGGLLMDNLSKVQGNVYANGDVQGSSGAVITGTASVAGTGTLSDVTVLAHAFSQNCTNAAIIQELHALAPGTCSYGSFVAMPTPLDVVPLPIADASIQEWKNAAAAGGTIAGNYIVSGSSAASLGPKKIAGNLVVEDSAQLTLTGTLWVTGTVSVKNSAQVRLASAYGTGSGVVVADGVVMLQNNSISAGSGQDGSYLMYLSTNAQNPAITIKNNAIANILYASAGFAVIDNNAQLKELTGYGVHLKNNAEVIYETGLQSAVFTSGPGAGWELTSWKEVE